MSAARAGVAGFTQGTVGQRRIRFLQGEGRQGPRREPEGPDGHRSQRDAGGGDPPERSSRIRQLTEGAILEVALKPTKAWLVSVESWRES